MHVIETDSSRTGSCRCTGKAVMLVSTSILGRVTSPAPDVMVTIVVGTTYDFFGKQMFSPFDNFESQLSV